MMSSISAAKQTKILLLVSAGFFLPLMGEDKAVIAPETAEATISISTSDVLEAQPYVNEKEGFKIRAPKGWQTNETKLAGLHVIFVKQEEKSENKSEIKFKSSVNVVSEVTQLPDVNAYVAAVRVALAQFLTDYKADADESAVIAGLPALIIGGTFKQGEATLKNSQLIALKDGKAYIVTATALAEDFAGSKDLFAASLKSFELIDAPAKTEVVTPEVTPEVKTEAVTE